MTLHGPDDTESFRTYDRWNRRRYTDLLPTDDTWPQWDEPVLSVTTYCAVWNGQFYSKLPSGASMPTDAVRVAEWAFDNQEAWQNIPREPAIEVLAGSTKRQLQELADRGTAVHDMAEQLAAGRDATTDNAAALPFLPSLQRFVADTGITFEYVEPLVFNRNMGYAGAADAIGVIDGKRYVLDYKTRKKHGCYEKDCIQLGGYSMAEYLIVQDGGRCVRHAAPDFDGGILVSVTDESYQLYPVNLDSARTAWSLAFHAHTEKKDGMKLARSSRGKPMHVQPAVADMQRIQWARDRIGVIKEHAAASNLLEHWPAGIPTKFGDDLTAYDLQRIVNAIAVTETEQSLPFPPRDPSLPDPVLRAPGGGGAVKVQDPDPVPSLAPNLVDAAQARVQKLAPHLQTLLKQQLAAAGLTVTVAHYTDNQYGELCELVAGLEADQVRWDRHLTALAALNMGDDHQARVDSLIETCGSKRDAVAAGKTAADLFGVDRQTSTDNLADNQFLFAYLTQPTKEEPPA